MLIRARRSDESLLTDMTPMIDMVFNLLIFFLVATTFHQSERQMQIALPLARTGEPISNMLRELVINVDAEGAIVVGGRTLDAPALEALVAERVRVNPQQRVTVRGDRKTAYANVVRVLDICKSAGLQEPYLDTVLGE
ncbi:MAG: biopolymer transporter ExbD [Phycisphaerae bacterium]|jgi:biopolymer transport protein ExbD